MFQAAPRDLTELLAQLYSTVELREFLAALDCADELMIHLPEGAVSRIELAGAAAGALGRRGRIDAAFWEALRADRPGQRAWIDALAQAPERAPGPAPTFSDAELVTALDRAFGAPTQASALRAALARAGLPCPRLDPATRWAGVIVALRDHSAGAPGQLLVIARALAPQDPGLRALAEAGCTAPTS